METIKNTLDEALLILSEIYVNRNNVELMAAAKQKIRAAISETEKPTENEGSEK